MGLFATEHIAKGTYIIEYTGEKISVEESDRRGGKYLFTVLDDVVIDGKGRENIARYINHSCRPNCYAEIDEENLKLPAVKDRIEQRKYGVIGAVLIFLAFMCQMIEIVWF